MATTKHKAYTAAIATLLTTEMNGTTNGNNSTISAAYDNRTNLDLYMDLTLTLATMGVARTQGGTVVIFIVPALDETNYDDQNADINEQLATFKLDAATTARQVTVRDCPIPPGLFKVYARNLTGQTLAGSGNLLEYRAHSIESA